MKVLSYPELHVLSEALSLSTPSVRVCTNIEAFSCKPVSRERKLFKKLDSSLVSDISLSTSLSPPEYREGLVDSVFGPLDKKESRKTYWLLIATLNLVFPDHDFTRVSPEEFSKEDGPCGVLSSLSNVFGHLRSSSRSMSSYPPATSPPVASQSEQAPLIERLMAGGPSVLFHTNAASIHPTLRQVLDPIINLNECEVFSYQPDADSDPHAGASDDEYDSDCDSDFGSDSFDDDDNLGLAVFGSHMDGIDSYNPGPSAPQYSSRPPSMISMTDDSAGGLLFSSYYFLFHRKMKRILFISVWGRKVSDMHRAPKPKRPAVPNPRNDLAAAKALEMYWSTEDPVSSPSPELPTVSLKPDESVKPENNEAKRGIGNPSLLSLSLPPPGQPRLLTPKPKRSASSASLSSHSPGRSKKRVKGRA